MSPRRSLPWMLDTPFAKTNCWTSVRSHPRSLNRSCRVCTPLWNPLSTPSRDKPSLIMPKPLSAACCRTWPAKTSNRSPIMLGKAAWGCKASSAGPTGTMPPCERRCLTTLARNWDKAMACWCSIPRRCQHPVARRWAWPDSGVAAWGKSTTVKSPSPWATWTQDKARRHKAGVPQARRGYRTRHQLAVEMLEHNGASLPHGWIAGDDEMGRPYWFRRRLAAVGERSMLAVPSNTMMRDLETPAPDDSGKGRPPKRPRQSVKAWAESLGTEAWRRVDVRDGAKGPLVVDVVKRRVVSRTHRRQQGDEELVAVIRVRDSVPQTR